MTESEVRDIAIGIARRRLESYPAQAAAAIDAARAVKKRHLEVEGRQFTDADCHLTVKEIEVLTSEILRESLQGFEIECIGALRRAQNTR